MSNPDHRPLRPDPPAEELAATASEIRRRAFLQLGLTDREVLPDVRGPVPSPAEVCRRLVSEWRGIRKRKGVAP